MNYSISFQYPEQHYINISLRTETKGAKQLYFQLPAWRPGRYELGNFAKNIQQWQAFDETGKILSSKKLTKDRWEVACEGAKEVQVKYNYFANELNAGSSYLDENQLYVNPVNCLIYNEKEAHRPCELILELPANYNCAIGLEKQGRSTYLAKDFDELADSPFIASASLQHLTFKESQTTFHLWFQGELKLDEKLLIGDFSAFAKEQIKLFGDFPADDYHFLFQIVPHRFYHGVEHSNSTVIVLGPSYDVLKEEGRYEDLLGVSSHELFHTWNVKRIRPIEMWPYDFTKENYTRLGYLTEGATTWYGDLMLYRSEVFGDAAFFRTFNQILDRHYNNPGALNLSVADSSFDTWLDGYGTGVPNRKASIYTEGALITFLLDVEIRKATQNKSSFDHVMRAFYEDIYKNNKGVSELDYRETIERVANRKLDHYFDNFINGSEDFNLELEEALDYLGLKMTRKPAEQFHEAYLGVKLLEDKVYSIFPNSPAEKSKIGIGDQIIAINGIKLEANLSEWLAYFKADKIHLDLITAAGFYKQSTVSLTNEFFYCKYELAKVENLNNQQEGAFKIWKETIV
ncbi:MAG: hypothetical protein RJQ00_02395 [Vicingaceae bacterium]